MRKMLFALAALAALALLAPNTGVAQGANNQIGIYTTETPDFDNITDADTRINGAGSFTIYIIVSNPYNIDDDHTIANLGGFEFRVDYDSALFFTPTIHPSATNFLTSPDFYCGCNIPMVNGMATVVTLAIGAFAPDPSEFFLSPVQGAPPSIPNSLAITDFDDDYSLAPAFPSSGSFTDAVFGFNTSVVPNEDASWGEVKSLYR